MRVDQYLPGFAPHDAIGNHTLTARRILRDAGYESDIWAEHILSPLETEARHYTQDAPGGDRVLLFHTSTSSAMSQWIKDRAVRGERVITDYHNITPGRYFLRWEPHIADAMEDARTELAMLAPFAQFSMADSAYNEAELRELGYVNTMVCNLLVDLEEYHRVPDKALLDRLPRRGMRWLFVGRVAPNKCQHDVVGAFAVYRRLYDPYARLTLVGGATSPRYRLAIERLAGELELGDSLEMVGSVSDAELLAYWAAADVFVCMSEHEGFCVPVLEAMELGVPVVAYNSTAVPETLAGAGVLVDDKDPLTVANAVHDMDREALSAAGRKRAEHFSLQNTSKAFLEAVESFLA
ncbi:MAG TPA: glycosyltransferase [Acidimicrobiales bacterium]|nr:glycosyltransferase [Acidimicrobiales bacterium]